MIGGFNEGEFNTFTFGGDVGPTTPASPPAPTPAFTSILFGVDRAGVRWFYVPRTDVYLVALAGDRPTVQPGIHGSPGTQRLAEGIYRVDVCGTSEANRVVRVKPYTPGPPSCNT
jgi:hypothetical protein